MITPISKVALDNTLGQSAFAWFINPKNPYLDNAAKESFLDFIRAYIESYERFVPIPGKIADDVKVEEPFIKLWQRNATLLKNSACGAAKIPRNQLWEQFEQSTCEDISGWSKWVRFQWTPEIVAAFKVRVPDWRAQFKEALEEIRPAASLFNPKPNDIICRLVTQLKHDLKDFTVDREYISFADEKGVDLAILAAAYAWNWFGRGASYRSKIPEKFINGNSVPDMTVRFHNLRDGSSKSFSDKINSPEKYLTPIDWGDAILRAMNAGLIERESNHFCEFLQSIREIVHKNDDYKEIVTKININNTRKKDDELRDAAVVFALSECKISPIFRETITRAKIINALAEIAHKSKPEYKGFNIGVIAYQIINIGVNSEAARKAEYRFRRKFYKNSLWKVFKAP